MSTSWGFDLSALREYLLAIANEEFDRRLQSKAGPSDLVQDAVALAVVRRDQFHGTTEKQFFGWVRTILLNVLQNFTRSWRLAQRRSIDREVPLGEGGDGAADDCSPPTLAMLNEELELLAQAVAQLPEPDQRVLNLRHEHGLSFPEVAAEIGVTEDAARMRYKRACERVRELLPERDE